jgi:hypothetical protein
MPPIALKCSITSRLALITFVVCFILLILCVYSFLIFCSFSFTAVWSLHCGGHLKFTLTPHCVSL